MFTTIGRFFRELFGHSKPDGPTGIPAATTDIDASHATGIPSTAASGIPANAESEIASDVVPFDETLLERCRTMWQSGDWESIKTLDRETLQHHPDRAKLALLAAAAHQQTGGMDDARTWLRLAREWGCSKQLISQIMISGVFNTLARASAAGGQLERAQLHFEEAMRCGAPKGNLAQLTQARIATQLPHVELASNPTNE